MYVCMYYVCMGGVSLVGEGDKWGGEARQEARYVPTLPYLNHPAYRLATTTGRYMKCT